MKKFPCRCSERTCRKRKTLPKHPDEYKKKNAKARIPSRKKYFTEDYMKKALCDNCGSVVSLCKNRKDGQTDKVKADKDRGKACHCDGRPLVHRHGQEGCNHREEFLIESAARGTGAGKISHDEEEAPF